MSTVRWTLEELFLVNYFSSLKIRTRFSILVLLGLIMAAIPMAMYVSDAGAVLQASILETKGIEPSTALIKVVRLTQQHRGLSALVLNGDTGSQNARSAKQVEVDKAVENLGGLLSKGLDDPKVKAIWDKVRSDWSSLEGKVSSGSIKPGESFAAHTSLINQLMRTMDFMADAYGLSLDPEYESYELVRAVLYEALHLTEHLGKSRGKGSGMLSAKTASPEDRQALALFLGMAAQNHEEMVYAFSKVMDVDAAFKAEMGDQIAQAQVQAKEAIELANTHVINVDSLTYSGPEYFAAFSKASDAQFQVIDIAMQQLATMLNERSAHQKDKLTVLSLALALLAVLGIVIGVLATKSVTKELGGEPADVKSIAESIKQGNLTTKIVIDAAAQTSVIAAMSLMQESIKSIVTSVRHGSEGFSTASAEIAQGNQDLSSRTEGQASALEQTAASLEELSSQVNQNAENAHQANQLASSASAVAVRGGEVVGRVVQTMKEINDSSRKISEIISVIDGIAFQTNILALNAAVEAARAGEQGRGFAVVASEVRSLAGRSAEAAKEIKRLINTSVERVEQGTELVDEAGSTMTEIVGSIRRVSDLVGEISAACSEQSMGVAQVGEAVSKMDQSTQQNAALVEQMAAAASSLKEQASELVQTVYVFKLGTDNSVLPTTVRSESRVHTAFNGNERRTAMPAPKRRLNAEKITSVKPAAVPKQNGVSKGAATVGGDEWETF